MSLASRKDERHGLAVPFRAQVELGAKAATRTAQRLVVLPVARARRTRVGADDRPIHEVGVPVEQSLEVSGPLQVMQQALPQTGTRPAAEADVDAVPLPVAFR